MVNMAITNVNVSIHNDDAHNIIKLLNLSWMGEFVLVNYAITSTKMTWQQSLAIHDALRHQWWVARGATLL